MPAEISAVDLAARLKAAEPMLIIDVREPWEREIGHLPADIHIPMNEIPGRLAEIAPAPGGAIVAYCHAGVRSFAVASFLEQAGHANVFSLAGGIDAWSCDVDPQTPRY
jgi:rhodanese-related sulfurtransferase